MKKLTLLIAFCLHILCASATQRLDSLIEELDQQIQKIPSYEKQKNDRINALRRSLKEQANPQSHFDIYSKIYNEYSNYNSDSAYLYSKKILRTAYQLNDPLKINNAKVKVGFILLSTGLFHEAIDTLKSMASLATMPKELQFECYNILSRTYFDMADYAENVDYTRSYNLSGEKYLNMALDLTDENSVQWLSLVGLKSIRNENYKLAESSFHKLLKNKLTDQQVAIAASSLAYLYRIDGKVDKDIEMLTIAAIADIKSSTKETVAMTKLSEQLFKKGEVQRAYKYVRLALSEAYFYKAKHRKLEIINILPIIEGKQLETVARQRQLFIYYSIAVTILSLLVIVFFVIILKQFKKLQVVKASLDVTNKSLQVINEKLQEVNRIKEEYIGQFFNMISENIEGIEKFKNSISRKIKSNKMEDIASIVKNIDADVERERLYASFDAIFLKIFPGFIEKFNSLFKKEDHIIIHEGHGLTPELRIFALIRLGIHDTETIAKILRYAVRTIYTYKTKIKNRSIVPNEEFEDRLFEIKAF